MLASFLIINLNRKESEMQSRTIQFKTIVVLILLIATTPLFAAEERARGNNRSETRRPEARQQLRRDRGREERPGGRDLDRPGYGRGWDYDRMHLHAEGLIPEPVKEKLNLTKEQKKQLTKIHEEQGEKIKNLSEEMSELREKLTEAVFEEARELEIRKIAGKMGLIIGDIAVIRSSGYAVLADILDEKQFKIIAEFREKRFKGAENFQKRMQNQRKERGEGRGYGMREGRGEGREYGIREGRGEGRESGIREGRGEGRESGRRVEAGQSNRQKLFDKRDANKDGKLTSDEMGGKEKSKRFFDRFDANKDGAVTVEEFGKTVEPQPQKRGRRERDDDR